MQFRGRSLYNLLKISLKEDPSIPTEPWQILNYRKLTLKELFDRLAELGVILTEESFCLYVEDCDTPEDLLECLWMNDEDLVGQDKVYLLLFELWRRFASEKQSLSVFCDELDELILLYDEGELTDEEPLQNALEELEDILDQSVDHGASPEEVFQSVTCYAAHDLEKFIYDYVLDLMDASNEIYASELVAGMSAYVTDKKWFEFLKARFFFLSNSPEANILMSRILEQAEEEPDLAFLMQVSSFLAHQGDTSLFLQSVKQMVPLIVEEEDLLETLKLIADFFRGLDKEESAEAVDKCMAKRKNRDLRHPIALEDAKLIEKFLLEMS